MLAQVYEGPKTKHSPTIDMYAHTCAFPHQRMLLVYNAECPNRDFRNRPGRVALAPVHCVLRAFLLVWGVNYVSQGLNPRWLRLHMSGMCVCSLLFHDMCVFR